jgi:glycosyltransferase involved in cell wall biosynthesis
MRRERVTVLHTHLFPDGFWGRLAAMAAGVPIRVVTQHNSFEGGNLPPRWQVWADRVLQKHTDRFVAVSRGAENFLLREVGVPRERVLLLPNAVSPLPRPSPDTVGELRRKWGLEGSAPVLGTVARLTHQKGIGYLLEAVSLLRSSFPDIRCVVLGEGELRDELEARAEGLGVSDIVVFPGVRKDVENVLALFDLFVLPSLFEGMPVALLEAMSVGLPVVATRLSSVSEIIDEGVDGLLASPGDGQALADAIADVLRDPEAQRRMSKNAMKKIRTRYSVERWVTSYDEMYRGLLREADLV